MRWNGSRVGDVALVLLVPGVDAGEVDEDVSRQLGGRGPEPGHLPAAGADGHGLTVGGVDRERDGRVDDPVLAERVSSGVAAGRRGDGRRTICPSTSSSGMA